MKGKPIIWITIFFILITVFLLRYHIVGQAVYGDGIYYWAYTRSAVIDRDLKFQNEGAHLYSPETNNSTMQESMGTSQTDLANDKYYPLGPSLIWIPFFSLVHITVNIITTLGISLPHNGYSDSYQITLGLINIGFVLMGMMLIHTLLRRYYSPFVAGTSTLLVLFGTNLLYYGSLDVLNSHPASFLLCSIFTYLFVLHRGSMKKRYWLGMGILLGLMSLVRLQDSLLILMPLFFFVQKYISKKPRITTKSLLYLFTLLIGWCIGFLPQLLVSKTLYGTFYLLPYTLGGTAFSLGQNKLLQLFINEQKGLLLYSPIFVAGLIGLFVLHGKTTVLKLPFLMVIVAVFILIGSWSGWSQGEAFGMRMFISLLPLIAFGVAEILRRMVLRVSRTTILLLCILFILHNLTMIAAFHLFFHNPTYVGNELSRSGKIKLEILQKIRSL
ncbi:MAG: hypothetical protein RLZZ455_268 [Candidatus Parcubacteria bacterium]|jgi:hypothetical protein